jgi:hypothetical protein
VAQIYADQHFSLKDLLAASGRNEDATLLIPDLQRPYVWSPIQVTVLVDSLIRGWPFGTLLTWKVAQGDPARELARSLWKVVDRTGILEGERISQKHPPAPFQMVLDGQQRVQSLLLAFGGDGWGFKLPDRQWHEVLSGAKARGPRGKLHWSLGCLCVDLAALAEAYAESGSATSIDYTRVLHWILTDDARGQSQLPKPDTYKEPLARASKSLGKYIRLSRLWEAAPEEGADAYAGEPLAISLLAEHSVTGPDLEKYKRPVSALLMALKEVKQTRVTYLELAEFKESLGARERYNDAIVNIFTRLNTAGRTLTREDITFAWLKIGWKKDHTDGRLATECLESLASELKDADLPIAIDDLVSAVSFVWAVAFNGGRLLGNDDLMKGDAIRPMAEAVSEHWSLVVDAAVTVSTHVRDRGLRFRAHYQSMSALAYLWAWCFLALRFQHRSKLTVREDDALDKRVSEALDNCLDRWLLCTQWAGVWSSSSARNIAGLAKDLADCANEIESLADPAAVVACLSQHVRAELESMQSEAIGGIARLAAEDRSEVRQYYTALWIWNRLDQMRWGKAQLALREGGRRANSIEVDHVVAFHTWQAKLNASAQSEQSQADPDAFEARVNELGNCMLLEKNFNISKGKGSLKSFLAGVHEFKDGRMTVEEWARDMDIDASLLDATDAEVPALSDLIAARTLRIRTELDEFIRGTKKRVDA